MKKYLSVVFVLFPIFSYSQVFNIGKMSDGSFETMNDYNLSVCVDDSVSVLGDCQCYERFSIIWMKEVDNQYNNILIFLKNDKKNSFIKSHESWIKYKNDYLNTSYEIYRAMENGGGIYDYYQLLVTIYRSKALELQNFYKRLK